MSKILINPTRDDMIDAGVPRVPFAFDLDSVMSESGYIRSQLCREFNITQEQLAEYGSHDGYQTFNFKTPDVSNNDMYRAVDRIVHDYSYGAPETPYMREVMWYLWSVSDLPIIICTARKRTNAGVTTAWLDRHLEGIPYHCFISCGREKYKILTDAGTNYFVDDRYKTIDDLGGHIPSPILYRRPWNQGRPTEASPLQVRDLRDMIPLINIEYGLPPATWPGYIPYPDTV